MVQEITVEQILELFDYNQDSGVLVWKKSNNRKRAGQEAGGLHKKDNSKVLTINSKQYKYHRIVWAWFYKKFPDGVIDHINGNPQDNRIINLRDCSKNINAQNRRKVSKNSKSGYLGVSQSKGHWRATIRLNGKTKTIGSYKDPQTAHLAYLEFKRQHHEGCTL